MNKEKVQELLKALGGNVTATTDKWVTCTCVFARWKHKGGIDNHPSSGMTIKEGGGESRYNCYTCKSKGNAYNIYKELKQIGNVTGVNFKRAMEIINMEETDDFLLDMPDYETEQQKIPNQIFDFDELWYSKFKTAYEHPYVVYRGIEKELAEELDLRVDYEHNRILFPIRDWEGVLVGVHGRTYLEDVEPRYYSYQNEGKRNPDVWMGENHVNLDEPVVLVEGQFDYAKVRVHSDNVLSAQTTSIQERKLKRISVASEIITMFDKGTGGDNGRELVDAYFPNIPKTHLEPIAPYGDLGEMPDELVYELLCSVA